MQGNCLACGRWAWLHESHWPIAKGMGGRSKTEEVKLPAVYMCFDCHIGKEHTEADPETQRRLIDRAPGYWKSIGKWDEYQEVFERWVDLKRYKGATGCNPNR